MRILTTLLSLKEVKKQLNALPVDPDAECCIIYNDTTVNFILTQNELLATLLDSLPAFRVETNENVLTKLVEMLHMPGTKLAGNCQLAEDSKRTSVLFN